MLLLSDDTAICEPTYSQNSWKAFVLGARNLENPKLLRYTRHDG